jgi:hypothetical protein
VRRFNAGACRALRRQEDEQTSSLAKLQVIEKGVEKRKQTLQRTKRKV